MNFSSEIASIIALGAIFGVAIGIIAKFWNSVKVIYNKCFSLVISTVQINGDETQKVVLSYLVKNFKMSSTQDKYFGSKFEHTKDGKYGLVSYQLFGKRMMMFWHGWFPIIYSVKKPLTNGEKVEISFWNKKEDEDIVVLYFIRNTFDIKKIITESANDRNSFAWAVQKQNIPRRFFIKKIPDHTVEYHKSQSAGIQLNWYDEGIYELLNFKSDQLGKGENNSGKLGNLVFPPSVQEIIQEAIQWRESKHWYNEKGIPWKRGWLLYGPPGSGKSALVRSIAQYLDMPLYVYSLGELENAELQKSWEEMQANSPCFALCEDFDNVFHGRTNVYNKPQLQDLLQNTTPATDQKISSAVKTGKLSFDSLLNCIDGVDKNEGIFTVITTNHVEHIDQAIGKPNKDSKGFTTTRPGRIDRAVELTYLRNEEKYILAERIFSDCPQGMEEMVKFIRENPNVEHTPSQWQEKCAQIALRYYWQNKNASVMKIVDEEAA